MNARTRRVATAPRVAGVVLAMLVVLAGLVAAREALASAGLLGLGAGDAWLPGALRGLDGRPVDGAVVAVGAGLAVLGVLLLLVAWRRGPADVAARGEPSVRLRAADLARLASATAEDVDGVLDVTSTATARSVRVHVSGTGSPGIADEVRAAVQHRLDAFDPAPRVRVQPTGGGDAR